jgi:hypothetical protein
VAEASRGCPIEAIGPHRRAVHESCVTHMRMLCLFNSRDHLLLDKHTFLGLIVEPTRSQIDADTPYSARHTRLSLPAVPCDLKCGGSPLPSKQQSASTLEALHFHCG